MQTRRGFVKSLSVTAAGTVMLPRFDELPVHKDLNIGLQLYTFRDEMSKDAAGTLEKIAALGIKQVESASSDKGHYYGLSPKEIKKICTDHRMTLRSGHIHLDDQWEKTMEEAAESGQEYLICASINFGGQTIDNYKKTAERFNKAGEQCKKLGIKFGYHNHDSEFDSDNGKVLYDVLLENTQPDLVCMELDLGWVITAGKDPLHYFEKYPGRFPLWHLKDMDTVKKKSVEFGKGALNIKAMFKHWQQSGLQYYFIEQEDYANNPFDSIKYNVNYLKQMKR
ncbi:MAG: sugar phosphate isomerase/epimerase [Ferruginibacter sp.]